MSAKPRNAGAADGRTGPNALLRKPKSERQSASQVRRSAEADQDGPDLSGVSDVPSVVVGEHPRSDCEGRGGTQQRQRGRGRWAAGGLNSRLKSSLGLILPFSMSRQTSSPSGSAFM